MSKSKLLHKTPSVSSQREVNRPNQTWSNSVVEVLVSQNTDGPSAVNLLGGAENGQFIWVGEVLTDRVTYQNEGHLNVGDIVLEVQGQCIAGYTLTDAIEWITFAGRNGSPVMFKTVVPDMLMKDMREFLSTRFQKGSVDHELQQLIRTNIYKRTVPCTTRPMRPGEVDGVDYRFLTIDEFKRLEESGELLESGIFDDNHYGTPKPPKVQLSISVSAASSESPFRRSGSANNIAPPGQHPSSDGKRRRNLSNVETNQTSVGSKSSDEVDSWSLRQNVTSAQFEGSALQRKKSLEHLHNGSSNGTSESSRNREAMRVGNNTVSDFHQIEVLPEGWERVDDPQYGVYYIERTQYENPVAKGRTFYPEQNNGVLDSPRSEHFSDRSSHFGDSKSPPPAYGTLRRNFFTHDPNELQGEFVSTTLVKSTRGLGFTIVGGDDADENNEEFLQIKNITPNGPAALDGKLKRSDVLVYIDGQCVLGYSHQDIIRLFQSIPVGETVTIDICRGYPLPFDPDDPSNEIITTIAVTSTAKSAVNTQIELDIDQSSGNILSVDITKGSMGFGFTIGDTVYGQCIKTIIDRSRCKGLNEGDLLIEINGNVVRNMKHIAVVELLKDCPIGATAKFIIQRGGFGPRLESENRRQETYESRSAALLPSQRPFDFPENSRVSPAVRDQGLKPTVYPKPTAFSRSMVLDNQISNAAIFQRGPSPVDRRVPYDPSHNETRVYSGGSEMPYSTEISRKQVQRGVSLRGDLLRQPLTDAEFSAGYRDRSPGFGQPESQNQEPFVGLHRNLANQLSFSEHSRASSVSMQGQTRVRSKTPGPDFLRGTRSDAFDRDPDAYMQQQAIESRREIRSKTPTQELPRSHFTSRSRPAVSGTPDFIPASQYISESSRTADMMTSYPASSQPFSSRVHSSASSLASGDVSLYAGQFADRTSVAPFRRSAPQMNIPLNADNGVRMLPGVASWTASSPASVASSRVNTDEQYYEMPVYLQRLHTGFGFRIIGGTEEGSQVSVGHVVPGGAADIDGHLRSGDEITFVDGTSVHGASHRKVVQLMTDAAQNGRVTLRIRRRAVRLADGRSSNLDRAKYNYPYDVTLHRRDYESFGFVMVSSTARSGSALGSIVDGSPADRSGVLHVGDRLLAVNGVNVSNLHHEHIVGLIKESGYSVVLTIGPPDDLSSSVPSSAVKQYPNVVLSSPSGHGFTSPSDSDLSQRSEYSPYHTSSVAPRSPADSSTLEKSAKEPYRRPFSTQPQSSADDGLPPTGGSGERLLTVELQRGARGFGFSIRGGQEFNNMPLYVLKIAEGGAAYVDGRLRVGDEILEINGRSTSNITHAEAIELIQSGNTSVRLLVKRITVVRSTQSPWPLSHSKNASFSSNGPDPMSNLPTNGLRQSESRNTSSSTVGYGQVTGKYQSAYR